MTEYLAALNGAVVGLFGAILAASFSGGLKTRRQKGLFVFAMTLILALQAWVYFRYGEAFALKVYPLSAHLTLLLVLGVLTHHLRWPLMSIFLAYLCCQLRRWIALLVVALFSGGAELQDAVELIFTLPLLFVILRFVSPAVSRLSEYPRGIQWQIGFIPALYYVFDYITRIYTDLLEKGASVVVEFMPFICCTAYLVFLLYHSSRERLQSQLNQAQNSLRIQLNQSVREIHALRESQALARQYRHDLRHHLQYLAGCLENGQQEQAKAYITDICREIEAQKVQRYCENESANLILSAFSGRASKDNIRLNVQGNIPEHIIVSDMDLCVLLSNALENALHACQPLAAEGKDCRIDVQAYEQNGKLFLQITNPTEATVQFRNGLPVSHQPGHGIGVQSIRTIVERYGGIFSFLQQEGMFILRLSL